MVRAECWILWGGPLQGSGMSPSWHGVAEAYSLLKGVWTTSTSHSAANGLGNFRRFPNHPPSVATLQVASLTQAIPRAPGLEDVGGLFLFQASLLSCSLAALCP